METFRILSLCGGGVRGVFQASYLEQLSAELVRNKRPSLTSAPKDYFELVAGTSTGAIVAIAIALGIDLKRVIELYSKELPKIFESRSFVRLARAGALYDSSVLRKRLEDVFGNSQLGQAQVPLLIAATKLDHFSHNIFYSLDPNQERRSIVDVALASAAAPLAFPPVKPAEDPCTYVDGGLWANSPTLAAMAFSGIPTSRLRVLSVGNGRVPHTDAPAKFAKPVKMFSSFLDLMFSCQESATEDLAQRLLETGAMVVVNAPLQKPIRLDDTSAVGQLKALATEASVQKTLVQARRLLEDRVIPEDPELLQLRNLCTVLKKRCDRFEEWGRNSCRNARRLRERQFVKQQPISTTVSCEVVYRISRDLNAEVERIHRVRAVKDRINHIEMAINVEAEADAVDFVEDLALELPEEFAYLVERNEARSKALLLVPLPEVPLASELEFKVRYCWPGMFRRLTRSHEDLEFTIVSVDPIDTFRVTVYMEPGSGKIPVLSAQGTLAKKGHVSDCTDDRSSRWPGKTYLGRNISPEALRLELALASA